MLVGRETADDLLGAVAYEILDIVTTPILLLRIDCRIVYANQAGELLLQAGRAFSRAHDKLSVQRREEHNALQNAVSTVAASGQPDTVLFSNRQENVNYVIKLRPTSRGLVVVSVAELRSALPFPPGWTQRLLGLPETYAALAEALANGENLAEFSARSNLTIGGVRTRLKKLLARTGTRSQADLVALMLRVSSTATIDSVGLAPRISK